RGGYGLTRILPGIAYKKVAKAIEGGTQFIGQSDFTALQNALLAQTGAISWAGPALGEDFGVEGEPDDIMEACFDDLVQDQGEGAGWRLPLEKASKTPETIAGDGRSTLGSGQKSIRNAVLWGGNLSVLVSLLGTPYWPEVKGGVLFIEDVNEHPFRIERMLTQLLHAGVLARQKAIVFGQFTGIRLAPHDKGYKLATVVAWLRGQLKVPVLTGLPYGHVPTKVLLPVGAKVDLLVEGRDALMVWGHL
ncbi:MAG: LD-carboxypeptidase, partial [Burkholderiaceae bacterium]